MRWTQTRRDDEWLLRMLKLYVVDGMTAREIAPAVGSTRSAVQAAMGRIKQEDCDHSGASVAGFYRRGACVPA